MKILVVYKSKSGFTKKYAEWISRQLEAEMREASKVTVETLSDYDTVIYGGGLYAGGISGVKLITKNLERLKGKKIAVFATGASPAREEVINEVRNNNFTPEQQKRIRFFYLRGGFDFNKLTPFLKAVMSLMKWSLKRKKNPNEDERGMLSAFDRPVDFTDEKNIKELISYVKG
ncbi:MAG: flavodoxin domain-containing protein [Bacteroidota bacterium]